MSKVPHIRYTKTMRDKYTIDANQGVLSEFEVNSFPTTITVDIFDEKKIDERAKDVGTTTVRFYKTKRGDKRMSIKNIKKFAKVGEYIWFDHYLRFDGDAEYEFWDIHIQPTKPVYRTKTKTYLEVA